jgi:hypothetical protein
MGIVPPLEPTAFDRAGAWSSPDSKRQHGLSPPYVIELAILLITMLTSFETFGMNMPETTAMNPAIIAYSIRS